MHPNRCFLPVLTSPVRVRPNLRRPNPRQHHLRQLRRARVMAPHRPHRPPWSRPSRVAVQPNRHQSPLHRSSCPRSKSLRRFRLTSWMNCWDSSPNSISRPLPGARSSKLEYWAKARADFRRERLPVRTVCWSGQLSPGTRAFWCHAGGIFCSAGRWPRGLMPRRG